MACTPRVLSATLYGVKNETMACISNFLSPPYSAPQLQTLADGYTSAIAHADIYAPSSKACRAHDGIMADG